MKIWIYSGFQVEVKKIIENFILTNSHLCLRSHKDIEICGDLSDIEISKCVFTWNDWSSTVYDGCNEFFDRADKKDLKYCYLYKGDTYFYGNSEKNPEGTWVRSVDFYFIIKNISAQNSKYVSVGTITVQLTDPSNYASF